MGDNHGVYQSPDNKSDVATLTRGQLSDILKVLDNARHVLDKYIVSLEERTTILPVTRQAGWSGRYCWPGNRVLFYRYVTMITISLQFFNLMIVSVIDTWPGQTNSDGDFLIPSACVTGLAQCLNLILVTLTSVHLAKLMYRHAAHFSLTVSTYVATTLLFAGVYTLTYRVQSSSWELVDQFSGGPRDQVFIVYSRFLLTSISTATLCGTDNVKAVSWYNSILCAVQMLLSFCYFASILGASLGPTISRALKHLQITLSTEQRRQDEDSANNNCLPYHVGCCCQTVQENIQLHASYPTHRRRSAPDFSGKSKHHHGYRFSQEDLYIGNEQDASSHC